MTLVKIDLRTLKKNPNAGKTLSQVEGKSDMYVKFVCSATPEVLDDDLGDNIRITSIIRDEDKVYVEACVIDMKPSEISKVLAKIGAYKSDITINYNNHIIRHAPEPNYFYNYCDPKLTCGNCIKTFKYSEREDAYLTREDEDEIFSDLVCPHCAYWDCCDIEFESTKEALRRKK